MAKWNSLNYYLNGVLNQITLTWAELDEIVGGMPASAVNHRAWWSGDRPNVRSWESAGFVFTDLQVGSQVTFVRRESRSAVVTSSSKTGLLANMHAVVEQADTEPIVAVIDSRSWVNFKGSETAEERNGIRFLSGKAHQDGVASNLLRSEGLACVGPIAIERDSKGLPVEYLPQDRYENRDHLPLNRHGKGPFCRFDIPKLPESPGVYAITVDDSVVYIGECQNFRERYSPLGYGVIHPRNCFVGGQSTNCKINARVLEATLRDSIPELWFAPEIADARKLVERNLISRFQPQWNGRG